VIEINLKSRLQMFLEKNFSGESINYHQIIALIIPVLVDQAFVVCLNLVNTAMISSSGVAAVSAVNMVDSLNIFLVNVFIAVSTGGSVVVAQYKGSGNDPMVSKASAGSASSVFLLAFCISMLVIVFHGPALGVLFGRAQPDVLYNAKIYLIGSGASYCGIALEEAACGALRGIGETRSSLALSLIMNLSYVLLNIVFINFLHMGIFGLVIAMNVSRYFGAFCAMVYLAKINTTLNFKFRDMFHFNPSMLKKILFIGLPFAAEQMFFNGGKILTQTFIVSLGTYALATNAICGSIAGLIQIPANALGLAVITVVGQCMGRRNIKDAQKFIRSFIWLSSFSLLIMGLVVLPFFTPLVSLFHPPEQIVHDIFIIMLINAIAQVPLWANSFMIPSALRAAGDAKFTSIVSMLSMWLFRIVLGYILGIVLPFGIIGVWLAMDCEWGVRGLIFRHRFKGDKWKQFNLIDS
jgi:putative MATE family efflux protein